MWWLWVIVGDLLLIPLCVAAHWLAGGEPRKPDEG
jgi:hypothetical protein